MSEQRSLLSHLGEAIDRYRAERQRDEVENQNPISHRRRHLFNWLLPNGGAVILIALLIATQSIWARPFAATNALGPSATTVNYQGRLADNAGAPLDGSYGMSFAIYDAATGGNLIWGPEAHPAVPVSDGLFSVGLGSQTSGGIPTTTWNGDRYLEITVGGETLSPRELIRSVPIAGMALTVPDGAIGSSQIADGAVGAVQIADGAVGTVQIADGSVTQDKAPSFIRDPVNDNTVIRYGYIGNVRGNVSVTFAQPFTKTPLVFITQREAAGGSGNYIVSAVSTTGFTINQMSTSNYGNIQWLAIGQ